jgi:hypothetical protein
MSTVIIAVLVIHVLVSVFWAGSTFALARLAGLGSERLILPQLGAATFAFLTGGYISHHLHASSFAFAEQVLLLGVACALIAATVQAGIGIPALRGFRNGRLDVDRVRDRIGKAQRVSAALLAVTVVTMIVTRYV